MVIHTIVVPVYVPRMCHYLDSRSSCKGQSHGAHVSICDLLLIDTPASGRDMGSKAGCKIKVFHRNNLILNGTCMFVYLI